MKKIFFVLINLLVIVVLLGGCTGFKGRLEKDYGNSHRLAIVSQTLNPEAEKNLEPVYGIDGNTADIIVESSLLIKYSQCIVSVMHKQKNRQFEHI